MRDVAVDDERLARSERQVEEPIIPDGYVVDRVFGQVPVHGYAVRVSADPTPVRRTHVVHDITDDGHMVGGTGYENPHRIVPREIGPKVADLEAADLHEPLAVHGDHRGELLPDVERRTVQDRALAGRVPEDDRPPWSARSRNGHPLGIDTALHVYGRTGRRFVRGVLERGPGRATRAGRVVVAVGRHPVRRTG